MFKKAFSLLEVAIVVCILTLTSYFIVQSYSSFNKRLLIKTQAEEIIAGLEESRQLAQSSNVNINIIFNNDNFRIEKNKNVIKVIKLKLGFTVNDYTLGFTSAGTPAYAGTIYICYSDREVAKVVLAPATGILRWEKI